MKTAVVVTALFAVVLVFVYLLGYFYPVDVEIKTDCITDADCVPATCCHARSCVSSDKAPDCSETVCTAVCQGPLDCGAGNCVCLQGKCGINTSSPTPSKMRF